MSRNMHGPIPEIEAHTQDPYVIRQGTAVVIPVGSAPVVIGAAILVLLEQLGDERVQEILNEMVDRVVAVMERLLEGAPPGTETVLPVVVGGVKVLVNRRSDGYVIAAEPAPDIWPEDEPIIDPEREPANDPEYEPEEPPIRPTPPFLPEPRKPAITPHGPVEEPDKIIEIPLPPRDPDWTPTRS